MSLLDFKLPSLETAEGQGLMAAALSLLQAQKMPGQRGLAGALGGAGQQYMQASGQARNQAMQSKLQGAQLAQMESLAKKQQEEDDREKQMRKLYARYATPGQRSAPGTADVNAALPPEMQIGALPPMQGKQAGYDYEGLASGMAALDPMKALQLKQSLIKQGPKFSTAPQYDQNGRAFVMAEDGTLKYLDGVKARDKLISEDLGGKKIFRTEYSPEEVGYANKTVNPDTVYSGGITMRGQNMTDLRARDLNGIAVEGNNIKRGEKKATEDMTKNSQIASFDTMLGTLDRLAKHPGLSRSVGLSGVFPTMPGSESANFQAELDTFQSQAFIPMVAQLKGMGALSDAEGKKLTAAVGALNPKMGESAFRDSVKRITNEMDAARERVAGTIKPKDAMPSLPPAQQHKGRVIRDTVTGKTLKSNGMSWVEEK